MSARYARQFWDANDYALGEEYFNSLKGEPEPDAPVKKPFDDYPLKKTPAEPYERTLCPDCMRPYTRGCWCE